MWGFGLSQRVSSGASGWHLDAPTLYYSFYHAFSPWSLPRVGNGSGKKQLVTPGHPLDGGSNVGKRVRPTKKTRPDASSHVIPRRGDGKDCAPPPLPPKEWGVRRACLAIFFLDLGLGDFLHRRHLEPAFGGNRRRGIPAGQSSRRDQCTGTGSFQLDASVCAYGQTCAHYIPSEPQPPQPPQPPHNHPTATPQPPQDICTQALPFPE